MKTVHDLLTTAIGPCELDNATSECAAGPREFCTHHRTPNELDTLLAPLAEIRELLVASDSLISLVRYREPVGQQTKADADALIPRLRRATEGPR